MKVFLDQVAADLYARFGNDLSRVAVVFPNKRAGLFFNEYLASLSDEPLWSPAYISINELLQNLSAFRQGDPIRLTCELYKIFADETKYDETLDEFYFWGELLINDFDDIDKNLVDAGQLFSNLQNLKQVMDGFDFLDAEQEEAIKQFFANFSIERRTRLKEKFISIWDKLAPVYQRFRERLSTLGIAYEGMIYRDAIEKLNTGNLPYDTYAFVGFNLLNKVEHELLEQFKLAGKALFYWDYDIFYTQMEQVKHEAGLYIKRNLEDFPNALGEECFDNLNKAKQVRFIAAPTENAQARYLPEWIRSVEIGNERENAVVLCNETLLLPVLHTIPAEIENINITMGFPLAQTPAYTFVTALIELQTSGYNKETGRYTYANVQTVLKHPYTQSISIRAGLLEEELAKNNRFYPFPSELQKDGFLGKLFTPQPTIAMLCSQIAEILQDVATGYRKENKKDDGDVYAQLYREALFKCYTIINRMLSLIETGELAIQTETFKRLVNNLLATTNIPFHGEPAIGMQVMGVLETRNLDFRNIIILSFNEGLLPKAGGDSSFIPYTLRKAFGMSTVENKDAIYAYYFYRLIQRAENITLLYNTSSDGLNRGEASRFLTQFLVEWPHPVEQILLEAGQSPARPTEICIEKDNDILEILHQTYDTGKNSKGRLTPSALNTYMDCPLKFYYRYIVRLAEPQEVKSEIDSATFGSIFHRTVELIYRKLTERNNVIAKDDLERLLRNGREVEDFVDKAFKELFFFIKPDEKPEYNGTQLINSKVIATYARQLLRNDLNYAPFEMVAMEKPVCGSMDINTSTGVVRINIGGIIDRIDKKGDTLRIVDYKTGGSPKTPANVEELFTPSEGRPGYVFQTFLYAAIMAKTQPENLKIAPALLYIHRASSEDYSPVIEMGEARKPKIPVDDFACFAQEFKEHLQELLEEVFNTDVPFTQTEHRKLCSFCDYKSICRR